MVHSVKTIYDTIPSFWIYLTSSEESPSSIMKVVMSGGISGINEDLEDHFTLCLIRIINRSVIFNNNQTETIIATIQTHRFAAEYPTCLRKLWKL